MSDLLPCPFCGSVPLLQPRYCSGDTVGMRLQCSCGITTNYVETQEYDRKRFKSEGPQNQYSGAYYDLDWQTALRTFWNTRTRPE